MFYIINAKYISGYKIEITFEDGSNGIIDFSDYVSRPGLYKDLSDINFFKNFRVDSDLGTIVWNNGLDIAPDTLYMKVNNISELAFA